MKISMLNGNLVVLHDDGQKVLNERAHLQRRIRNLICVLALQDWSFTASELRLLIWKPGRIKNETSALTSLVRNTRLVLPPGRLLTSPPGKGPRRYSLTRYENDTIDVDCFRTAIDQAKRSMVNGELECSARFYARALSLWSATTPSAKPLADLPGTRLMAKHRDDLRSQRREAIEAYAELELRLGRHTARLADEIRQSVRLYPTNTRLWRLHVLALYRAGYRGDALRALQDVRALFETRFQAGPGLDLDQLKAHVLADDPLLWTDAALQDSQSRHSVGVAQPKGAAKPSQSPSDAANRTAA